MEKLYQQRGGAWIGNSFGESFQASWPFGKIELYSDKLVLSALGKREEILVQDTILKKRLYIPFFAWGIQIKSKNKDDRQFLYFWSLSGIGKFMRTAQKLGVPIE